MTNTPTLTQAHFRIRTDTNTPAGGTPTWAAAEDTNAAIALDTNFRVRFSVSNTGSGNAVSPFVLRYSLNGGTYTVVSTSSTVVRAVDASTASDPTTIATTDFLLTASSVTAVTGIYSESGSNTGSIASPTRYTEYEFGIVLRSADLVSGDTVDLHIYNSTTAFTNYTQTPRFTVPAVNFGDLLGRSSNTNTSIPNPFSPSSAIDVSVGDLVIVDVCEILALTSTTCTDNLGNSYTALTSGTQSNANGKAWYARVTTAGSCTPSVTTTASGNDAVIAVAAYLGPFATSPLDQNPAILGDSVEPYTTNLSGTLSQADELVVGYFNSSAAESTYDTPSPGTINSTAVIAGSVSIAITSTVVAATTSLTMAVGGVTGTRPTVCGVATFKKSSGANAWDGAADWDGASTLSAFANLNAQVTAQFSGAGVLQAYANLNAQTAATFSGAGNLSVDAAKPGQVGQATFAGAGNLSALASITTQGVVRFNGAGNLSVTGRLGQAASVSFAGAGNLNVSARLNQSAAAIFGGLGNLSVDATVTSAAGNVWQGAATFAGAGNLSALATVNQIAAATFAGTGNLQTLAFDVGQIAARFNGIGNLSAAVTLSQQAAVFFIGSGNLSVTARLGQSAFATFAGLGNLSTYANLNAQAAAIFGGFGNLSATYLSASNEISATFAGAGSLVAQATQANVAASTLGGSGNLSAVAQGVSPVRATFAGAGNLSALVTLNQQAFATFNGLGNLSALVRLTQQGIATFSGGGNLSVAVNQGMAIAARFDGVGLLSSVATQSGVQFGSATLSGSGNLYAYAVSAQQAAVRFIGAGSLLADLVKYKLAAVTFAGNSTLSVTYSIVKYGEIRLQGASSLSAGTIARMSAAAIFGGQGFMRANVTGGRGPRSPTRESISRIIDDMRPDQTQDERQDQTQSNRRLKITHG